MKSSRRNYPEVNAGSMADIAFLLLIFFLVTAVIPKDKGINRKLPAPCPENINCNDGHVNMRNILVIQVNANDELLVDDELISINELKTVTKAFLTNNGDGSCDYCDGLKDISSSDNPKKAIVSLANDTMTSYNFYIKVQDEITKAYYELRRDYARNEWNKSTNELSTKELQEVRKAYPFKLSEAEIKH